MVRAVHRLGGGVGGRRRKQGRRTSDEACIRGVELQPDFNTIQVCLVENIKDTSYLHVHKMFDCALYLRQG